MIKLRMACATLLGVSLLSCLPGTYTAASSNLAPRTQSLQQTLETLERKSWAAWKARDSKFFEAFLSADHLEIGGHGVAGKAAVLQTVATPNCQVRSYSLADFHFVQLNAATAVLTYRAEQDTTCSGAPVPSPAWATSVYVERGHTWLNAVYQQTPLAK